MQVAPEGVLWWDEKQPDQTTLWESWIQLGEKFFEAITAAPVPVDMRAQSPEAISACPRSLCVGNLYRLPDSENRTIPQRVMGITP